MNNTKRKYDEEFKKNAVKLTYGSSKGVPEIALRFGYTVRIRLAGTLALPNTGVSLSTRHTPNKKTVSFYEIPLYDQLRAWRAGGVRAFWNLKS